MATKLQKVKFNQSELSLETFKYISCADADIYVAQINVQQRHNSFNVYLQYNDIGGLEVFDPFVTHPKRAVQERIAVMKYGRDISDSPELWPTMILEKLLKWGFRFFVDAGKV